MAVTSFTPIILTGVKKVLFTPWGDAETLDFSTATRYDLQHLVGDTVSVTQDDNETNEIPCETRDEPLYQTVTLGKYNVNMESGDISPEFCSAILGFAKNAAGTIAYAPDSYSAKYAHIEIQMDKASFILPYVQVAPNLTIESLKTNIARAVVGGVAYSADVATGTGKKRATPFFTLKTGTTAPSISLLGQGAGTYETGDVDAA